MKVAGADDDFGLALGNSLDLVAPLARGFEGGFDGLGAGVHREDHVIAGEVVEIFAEQGELVVAEGARGKGDFGGLLVEGGQDFWMAMALVDGGIGGQAVEITLAVDVVHPDTLGTLDDDVERVIIVRSMLVFQLNQVMGAGVSLCLGHHGLSLYCARRTGVRDQRSGIRKAGTKGLRDLGTRFGWNWWQGGLASCKTDACQNFFPLL